MSIYDEIKADHAHHRELLERIAATSGASDERKAAWEEFYYDVKSHAAAEEETFYSKLMSKTWGQDAARHSVEEHAEMDDLMEELNDMDMSVGAWLTKFKELKHEYEHHMEEEEEEIFAKAKEVIPAKELKGYGEEFRKRKAQEIKIVDQKAEEKLED